ncbi:hypothetical protein IMZ48_07465 [Candidatus Bathyarchaeota archaeon]|nr:hypothetical protein [Candidatus Bathyarchaeota archaeon]
MQKYRRRIFAGFAIIGLGWLVVMLTYFLTCRPFNHLWQVYPNPGGK